jgi:hypothetical protein
MRSGIAIERLNNIGLIIKLVFLFIRVQGNNLPRVTVPVSWTRLIIFFFRLIGAFFIRIFFLTILLFTYTPTFLQFIIFIVSKDYAIRVGRIRN